jgi:chaperonin GroES
VNTSGLTPLEFFVIVELDPVEEKTAGGVFLPTTTQDKDELSAQKGTLIAVSPHAFSYADNWPEGSIPQPGARVLFKKYNGYTHKCDGKSYRVLNDKDIIATIEPEAAEQRRAA